MIRKGDTVKVTGTTWVGDQLGMELIKIGTVCQVVDVDESRCMVMIETGCSRSWWYPESSVEKGHMEWIKDEEESGYEGWPTWMITGPRDACLPALEIIADSFDTALAKAKNLDSRYNTGQVKED